MKRSVNDIERVDCDSIQQTRKRTKRTKPKLSDLPTEMIGSILEFLPIRDIAALDWAVCKKLYDMRKYITVNILEEITGTIAARSLKSGLRFNIHALQLRPRDEPLVDSIFASDSLKTLDSLRVSMCGMISNAITECSSRAVNIKPSRLTLDKDGGRAWFYPHMVELLSSSLMSNLREINTPSIEKNLVCAIELSSIQSLQVVNVGHVRDSFISDIINSTKIPLKIKSVNIDLPPTGNYSIPHQKYDHCESMHIYGNNLPRSFFQTHDKQPRFKELEHVSLMQRKHYPEAIDAIMDSTVIPKLKSVRFQKNTLMLPMGEFYSISDALANDPRSLKLERLSFGDGYSSIINSIAESPYMSNLRYLKSETNDYGLFTCIAHSPYITKLERLSIKCDDCSITDDLPLGNFRNLRSLSIKTSDYANDLLPLLAKSECITRLERLKIEEAEITNIEAIGESKNFSNLKKLILRCDSLDSRIIQVISKSKFLINLEELILDYNLISDIQDMALSDNFMHLRRLDLKRNKLGNNSTDIVHIKAPLINEINIMGNSLTQEQADSLRRNELLSKLEKYASLLLD